MTISLRDTTAADRPPTIPHVPAPDDPRPPLPSFLRDHLGRQLRAAYEVFVTEAQPRPLLDLAVRLEGVLASAPDAPEFRDALLAALPALRAFATSLTGSPTQADDLVQDTLLRAWQSQHSFTPGTNLNAWLFTILRNQFYTTMRKRKREVEDSDGTAAAQLTALPSQEDGIELREVWTQLGKLPPLQREALLLIATQDLTYEAAAELMGCQTGTVKSRVNRARAALVQALGYEDRLGRTAAL
ncbi:MAG: sigma-70 family RNA polymerase sigma factor [Methylobacterium sp.]|uniref:sigma-70 family RNA polymerase sigma factor n=1 Tax=Methylobacterium sp. TaxID=409 RepID=UPI002584C29F|nr:sigma-70 family RNA polymerase sigma factor [Methylobacterium sp.]MBY0297984.1 sigma-70 family RNA polymerase sigma factor [Methylobacterium sp.]